MVNLAMMLEWHALQVVTVSSVVSERHLFSAVCASGFGVLFGNRNAVVPASWQKLTFFRA